MRTGFKIFILVLMVVALAFGFLNLFLPSDVSYNFDRLHIFLFNLCSGGSLLLYFTEGQAEISTKVYGFLVLTILYAVFAFFEIFPPVLLITLLLIAIVETIRVKRFSLFPFDFFRSDVLVSEKFHQAALLCLSLGLLISAAVILNNHYLRIVFLPKLHLDTFFLGFSFPLSLITLSLICSIMSEDSRLYRILANLSFWSINLGVIIFFLFIIFEMLVPQLVVTTLLFATVVMMFFLFGRLGQQLQQKAFLISGMGFLIYTAVTGILYILYEFVPGYSHDNLKWLLRMHSFASLYGWNLCGLAIICRYHDFPLRLHSTGIILLHWITVILLAPLGSDFRFFAIVTLFCYTAILYAIFLTKGRLPVVGPNFHATP